MLAKLAGITVTCLLNLMAIKTLVTIASSPRSSCLDYVWYRVHDIDYTY
jgi:hypothetical protein